ncbi:hypothetical protein BH09PAT2_BH09PAT2_03550 [soil metagenome]
MTLSFVDIETTGSRVQYDRIIEIGILRVEEGSVVKTYNKLINPEMYLSPYIENMTGISGLELERAPIFDDLKEEIMEILDGSVFVAHNVRFDYGFLKNEMRRYGLDLSLKQLCTVKLSRALYPHYRRHNLDALIERFAFNCENRHRAFDDARILWDFYNMIHKEFDTTSLEKTVALLIKSPTIPTHLNPEEIKSLPEGPGVYKFYDEKGLLLYIGKSTNIKERVLSHFTNDYTSTKEMNLVREVAHIEAISTAGELGALLMEAHLIKKELPIYNRQLRKINKLTVIKKATTTKGYNTLSLHESECIHVEEIPDILGIFRTQRVATEFIRQKAVDHKLCEKLLGVEKGSGACFGSKIERCRGACISRELPIAYNLRFTEAFYDKKIKSWPFKGPIYIKEYNESAEKNDIFMIDRWCLIADESRELIFDFDMYKILRSFIFDEKNKWKISNVEEEKYLVQE